MKIQARIVSYLFRPAKGGSAAVILVFATLLWIAFHAGIFGLPLAIIIISWFFKYAYLLFDSSARGCEEPPVLDIQMINPLAEQRPLGQTVIAAVIIYLVILADRKLGAAAATLIAVVATLFFPASITVLGLKGNVLKAANPVAWLRIALTMGPLYAVALAVMSAYAVLCAQVARWEHWNFLQLVFSMFSVLSIFSVLGGFVYEKRDEFGFEGSPERKEGIRQQAALRDSERQVTEAYGKVRTGLHIEAWQMLQTWLTTRDFAPDDYRWLCNRVQTWGDSRYITRLTEDYVERLLALKRSGEALDVVASRLAQDPSFRPKTAASTLQIAQLGAVGGGTKRLARAMIADFASRFPGDPRTATAESLARELAT